jgi:uncharacterized protein DUF4242
MKNVFVLSVFMTFSAGISRLAAQDLYIDVHHFGAGKVTYEAVAGAHLKDLATEKKYGVKFTQFWVDEKSGDVFCLSSAPDSQSIRKTHAEAHGLLQDHTVRVIGGTQAPLINENNFFLDVIEFGPGKINAQNVEAIHQKDVAVQEKYRVNFINYWLDEKNGRLLSFSQAVDSTDVINAHKEALGMAPADIMKVKPGQ